MSLSITCLRILLLLIISPFTYSIAQIPGFKILSDQLVLEETIDDKNQESLPISEFDKYVTAESFEARYLKKEITKKKEELSKLKDELEKDSKSSISKGTTPLSAEERKKKLAQIQTIREEIGTLNFKRKAALGKHAELAIKNDPFMLFTFGTKKSEAFFDMLYSKDTDDIVETMNNTGLNFGSQSAALYSEFASGGIGPVRLSFGAAVVSASDSDSDDERQKEAYQRLASQGGNTVLNLEYPLLYSHSQNQQFNLLSRFLARGAADFEQFGTTTEKVTGNVSYGADIYMDIATKTGSLRLFTNFNFQRFKGSQEFKENLGVGSTAFNYGQLILGLVVSEKIKLSLIVATVSSEKPLRNSNIIAGGQLLHE